MITALRTPAVNQQAYEEYFTRTKFFLWAAAALVPLVLGALAASDSLTVLSRILYSIAAVLPFGGAAFVPRTTLLAVLKGRLSWSTIAVICLGSIALACVTLSPLLLTKVLQFDTDISGTWLLLPTYFVLLYSYVLYGWFQTRFGFSAILFLILLLTLAHEPHRLLPTFQYFMAALPIAALIIPFVFLFGYLRKASGSLLVAVLPPAIMVASTEILARTVVR